MENVRKEKGRKENWRRKEDSLIWFSSEKGGKETFWWASCQNAIRPNPEENKMEMVMSAKKD